MGEVTKIAWCDHTFNGWRGCAKVSAGCEHCYAEAEAKRFPKNRGIWGTNGTRVVASEAMWAEPLKWNRDAMHAGVRARVFSASLSDWLEDWTGHVRDHNEQPMWVGPGGDLRPLGEIRAKERLLWERLTLGHLTDRLLALIAETPWLDWLLLTKRPEGFVDRMRQIVLNATRGYSRLRDFEAERWLAGLPPPNVWVGTSVEDQRTADLRIPQLVEIPARVRFLSAEPLLERIDFVSLDGISERKTLLEGIHWVIVGGESGPKARPCELGWITSIRDQCRSAGVACFVKQLGAVPVVRKSPFYVETAARTAPEVPCEFPIKDPKGGDPDEWPDGLRVRQFPFVPETAHARP